MPSVRARKASARPAPTGKAEAFARLHTQGAKRRDARARARRETEVLERLVAESVSSEPSSATWYDHPGVLTREETIAAAALRNAQGLHALMERKRS